MSYPVYSAMEMEDNYLDFCRRSETICFDLGDWLPSFRDICRPLVPGELAFFMAATGVGKSAILQSIAMSTGENCLFFELELPVSLMFERFMAAAHKRECRDIEKEYKANNRLGVSALQHIFVCDSTRLASENMKEVILKVAERMHGPPVVVLVDYIGLMASKGKSRYERVGCAAEELKVLAKETNTIVIAATQVSRPETESDTSYELDLYSAKDSGQIENSCGLLVGAWRDKERPTEAMWLKILKNTKGRNGDSIKCVIDLAKMQISEESKCVPPPDFDDETTYTKILYPTQ